MHILLSSLLRLTHRQIPKVPRTRRFVTPHIPIESALREETHVFRSPNPRGTAAAAKRPRINDPASRCRRRHRDGRAQDAGREELMLWIVVATMQLPHGGEALHRRAAFELVVGVFGR